MLIVCPTRPALLEASPDWGAGGARDSDRARAARCRGEQGDDRGPAGRRLARLRLCWSGWSSAAEGNPLFAEQLLRMLTDEGVLEQRERRLDCDWTVVGRTRATDDPGAVGGPARHSGRGRARGDRACLGRRLRVRGGSRGSPRSSRRVDTRADRARDPRPEALRPARRRGRRGAPSLPAHHDPRYRIRRHPQARAGGPPRAVRRLGRRGQPRPRRGIRGDSRLPPRTGVDIPLRARTARRPRPRDRRGRRAAAGISRSARFRPRRRSRRGHAARSRGCASAEGPPRADQGTP